MELEKSPVLASISVPPNEQQAFKQNRDSLMNLLEKMGKKMSFSNIIRLVVNTGVIEERDGTKYLVVKI